jgi:hypothetical protein
MCLLVAMFVLKRTLEERKMASNPRIIRPWRDIIPLTFHMKPTQSGYLKARREAVQRAINMEVDDHLSWFFHDHSLPELEELGFLRMAQVVTHVTWSAEEPTGITVSFFMYEPALHRQILDEFKRHLQTVMNMTITLDIKVNNRPSRARS